MTSMTAVAPTIPSQADERQTLPPITCTPWCTDGDGHPNEVFRADQWCRTEERATMLTRDYTYRDRTSEVDTVAVSVQRDPGRCDARPPRGTAPGHAAPKRPRCRPRTCGRGTCSRG